LLICVLPLACTPIRLATPIHRSHLQFYPFYRRRCVQGIVKMYHVVWADSNAILHRTTAFDHRESFCSFDLGWSGKSDASTWNCGLSCRHVLSVVTWLFLTLAHTTSVFSLPPIRSIQDTTHQYQVSLSQSASLFQTSPF
jgi:hypothetical protein